MKFLYNDTILKDRRRQLRKGQTDHEKIVWNVIKNKQCKGYRFLRQYSVGPYILDFYCPKLRLAIEIDGSQHAEKEHKEYDEERDQYLSRNNITVLRFWNNEVSENLDGVYDRILEHCP